MCFLELFEIHVLRLELFFVKFMLLLELSFLKLFDLLREDDKTIVPG